MRLLIVSNRLPVVVAREDGKFVFRQSAGGLVSGLSAYLDHMRVPGTVDAGYVWAGWPGIAVPGAARPEVRRRLNEEFNAHPVFISEQSMDKFYLGFCNRTIWPLFHYFTTYASYTEDHWREYVQVNKAFRDAVMEIAKPTDLIWVHDYHLMLLPSLLREQLPSAKIGFFLHIPFPAYEVYRLLPNRWRDDLLRGLLGADLIGFHTDDYTRYFIRCIERILGYRADPQGRVEVDGRVVRAGGFPMGIDVRRFTEAARSPQSRAKSRELRQTLRPSKIVLSIDRLDYTKGVINRLQAYDAFLRKYPEWRGQVVLVLVVVPSRVGVEEYQRTKRQVDELVGRINGAYGSIDWAPIRYQFTFLPFKELVALYAASDVALVTPIRDGMNLIAKEYLASCADGAGVLVLSETAGAAAELSEAIIVNPNDTEGTVEALKLALEMPEGERTRRGEVLRARLLRQDVLRWADGFLQALLGADPSAAPHRSAAVVARAWATAAPAED